MKTERTQIHFLSDVLDAVASLELKVLKVTLHRTIRNDDFQRHTGFKYWNNIAAIRNNEITML